VTPLRIVLDRVIRPEADPLGQRPVLPLLLCKSALSAEGLLGRLRVSEDTQRGEKTAIRLDSCEGGKSISAATGYEYHCKQLRDFTASIFPH